jgi:hypothetical protein
MEQVKKHLAMVFHKFIEQNKINIFFQEDKKVNCMESVSTVMKKPHKFFRPEKIQNGKVEIEGFVLPHKSKISEEQYKIAEGAKGWNEQQGFYIYRNEQIAFSR